MRQISEERRRTFSKCVPACIWEPLALFVTNAGIIASIVFVLGSTSAGAQKLQATFGTPKPATGTSSITVQAEVPGVAPNTIGTGGVTISPITNIYQNGKIVSERVNITIPITNSGGSMGKANSIAIGLKQAFGGAGVGRDPSNPNQPTIILPAGSIFSVVSDTTGEGAIAIANVGGVPSNGNILQIDWANNPAGLDVNGNASVFDVSFGYDGLTDSATVDGSPSLTLESLEQEMFAELDANLPTALQGDLSFDTSDFGLTFLVPDGSIDAFVNNSTTDIDTAPLGGINDIQDTPEPSSLLLIATGLAGIVAWSRRRMVS